jgi:hypothetical protein
MIKAITMQVATLLKKTIRALVHTIPIMAPYRTWFHYNGKQSTKRLNCEHRRKYKENEDLFVLDNFEKDRLNELKTDGYTVLEGFFSEQVGDLRVKLSQFIDNDQNIISGDISTFDHKYRITLADTLYNIPEFTSLAYHESILKITAAYKEEIPVYYGRAYRTLPTPEPKGSSFLHRDGYGDFTIFVFLEDVGSTNGSGTYIRGSHNYNFKSNIPFSWDERHIRDVYNNDFDWVTYGGKAGTVLIADTTGYHKGPCWEHYGDPGNSSRDVLHWVGVGMNAPAATENGGIKMKLKKGTVESLTPIQKLFLTNDNVSIED